MADRLAGLQPGAYIFGLVVAVAIAIGSLGVGLGSETVASNIVARIDGIFSSVIAPNGPGAAVLVRRDGRDVFVRGYGVRELRSKSAIDAQTNFRLASCTKQFTAMAIMLLVRDGKLRYDESLTEVFPGFPPYGKAITIRHLLNHTSGLRDYESLMDADPRGGWTEEKQIIDEEVLALLERQNSTLFAPGTKWAYSNSGYVVLGLVVAKVSAKPFDEFLLQRVFAPTGMEHAIAYVRGQNEVGDRAFGHTKTGNGWEQTDQSSTSATLGDGGVYSSVADLAKWDEALARHTLLSEGEMRAALTPVQLYGGTAAVWPVESDRPAGTPVAYGFGWFLDPYRGHSRMWHYGDTRGFHTFIERFLEERVVVVVLCNRTDLDPEKLAGRVANLFFVEQ